ncbi:hypothetical protein ACHAWO_012622 [Cyclotella atomus]|uniref:Uncharacterized protein n=1 Tax=Cyclotella atomus TaxID=382360 RepID=A0ABD3PJM9_9STRA
MPRFNARLPLLAITLVFATVNYQFNWKYDDPSVMVTNDEELQRILGMAPPKHHDIGPVFDNTSQLLSPESLVSKPANEGNGPNLEQMISAMFAHKPMQKRTGVAWNGWPKQSATDDPNKNWWRQSKMCFEVDNICHMRSTNGWFYYEPQLKQQVLFQPSMQLRFESLKYDGKQFAERRINITVDASNKSDNITFMDIHTFQNNDETCKISPIPTHVVLQSLFNFMIGEFYVRTLSPLHLLMTSHLIADGTNPLPQDQDIQFYVHLSHGGQKFYDGHKLLLSGMLSKENAAEVKAMLDLFDVSETDELDGASSDCECFEKMVFCGYDVYQNDTTTKSSKEDLPTPDSSLDYTLWNAAHTASDLDRLGYCDRDYISKGIYSCKEWADLRHFLASNFPKRFPSLNHDILRYRKDVLVRNRFVESTYNGTTTEWKFVGLAQRSYRRSWLNLHDVMQECNSLYQEKQLKVVCVEINVEKTITTYEQLVLHQSVDSLIGVHGAQMTQAVLLPQHGDVLELLPWVPKNYTIRGEWVQTRHFPTPLGVIYHNTDLNHLGYSLGRASVPLCEGVGGLGSEEEKKCLTNTTNRKQFVWDSRDFNVDPAIILQYIEHFLLVSDDAKKCSELAHALDGDFVLYNVWCEADDVTNSSDSKLTLKHYYDSFPESKQKSRNPSLRDPSLDIDIVSLTVKDDFLVLFNNSAIDSWIQYIQNVRSITFIGPESDYFLFEQHLQSHTSSLYADPKALSIPIRWVNETHWMDTYKTKHRCAYAGVCQQLIKLHVFDLKIYLNLSDIGDNILIVDSDTVWSREVTFIHHNQTISYFERMFEDDDQQNCQGSDPIRFVEAISIGRKGIVVSSEVADEFNHKHTLTPYKSCRRPQYSDANGARHIVHFMLFQQDVMRHLHQLVTKSWHASSVWQAVTACHKYEFCKGRISEYELYYAFMVSFYPERMHVHRLTPGKDWMNSAICGDREMQCCREKNVLLKGCHDHRIKKYLIDDDPGDMCCIN